VVDKQTIRFGLAAVKNVGRAAVESIIKERRESGLFSSLIDFCQRVDLKTINRRVVESLIKCGAFDSLKASRAQLLSILERSIQIAQDRQKEKRNGQTSLFMVKNDGLVNDLQDTFNLTAVPEFTDQELLTMEKETLGFYLSHHPLEDYQEKLTELVNADSTNLEDFSDKSHVILGGVITNIRRKSTKNGNIMAYFSLEDLHGTIEIIVFPKTFEEFKEVLREENVVIVEGRLDAMEVNMKLLAETIIPINEYQKNNLTMGKKKVKSQHNLHIEVDVDGLEPEKLDDLKEILQKYPGTNRVIIHFKSGTRTYHHYVDEQLRVKYNKGLVKEIKDCLIQTRIWLENEDSGKN